MTQNIIEITNLSYEINDRKLYDSLNLSIPRGSFMTVIGPTGSGKSMLSKIIIGKIIVNSSIKIDGTLINEKNKSLFRNKMLYLFDDCTSLLVCNSVRDNLFFAVRKKETEINEIDKYIDHLAKNFSIDDLLSRNIKTLSTSEKQLVGLVCAIIIEPKILIIDEVLTGFAKDLQTKLLDEFKKLNKKGMTIIHFTQDSELLLEGTHISILNKGKILLNEKKENAFSDDKLYLDNKIDLPFVVEMSIKLKYYGITDKLYYNIKDLVNFLWK